MLIPIGSPPSVGDCTSLKRVLNLKVESEILQFVSHRVIKDLCGVIVKFMYFKFNLYSS